MRTWSLAGLVLLISGFSAFAQLSPGNRGHFGVGYDEGLAGRFFFTDNMGVQASIGFEHLGAYDVVNSSATPATTDHYASADDISFAGAFIYNFLSTQWVYLDALGQMAYAYHNTRSADDINDRGTLFVRLAAAPEILICDHLGLGFRFGFELAVPGNMKVSNAITEEGTANVRFFGPSNPLNGPVLGMSLYAYFGQ
jgi:hypothetical protein